MNYLLQAWSEGNIAKRAGAPLRSNPYPRSNGAMFDAWVKGWKRSGKI